MNSYSDCNILKEQLKQRKISLADVKRCSFTHRSILICCPAESSDSDPPNIDIRIGQNFKTGERSDEYCDKISNFNQTVIWSEHIVNGERAEVGEFPHVVARKLVFTAYSESGF